MFQDLPTAIPLGFFLAFLVGPVFFVLLETAAVRGVRAAIMLDLGVILSDVVFIGIAYLSSYQLLENLRNQPGLYILGGAILVVYGLALYIKKPTRSTLDPNRFKVKKYGYLSLFIKGFLLNFINIGVLVFWLGAVLTVGSVVDNNLNRLLVFFGGMIGTYFITDLFKILLAKQLRRKLTPRLIFKLKKLVGFILIICGMVLISKGFLPEVDIQKGIEKIQQTQ